MKSVLILSGGMDSGTLLFDLKHQRHELKAISFNYGQRHGKELECAKELCNTLNVEHKIIDLTAIKPLLGGSSQTDDVDVPEGHFQAESMKLTVVPNRNMIMLALAKAWAVSLNYDQVAYANHTGDHDIYPDCREVFVEAMDKALRLSDWKEIGLISPYQNLDKCEIIKIGMPIGVQYDKTWTCYKGLEIACGKCGSCQERLEGFKKAGYTDPLKYEGDVNLK